MRFDTRTLKHRLRRKEISPEELDQHLEALPDEAEELVEVEVRFSSPYEERHHRNPQE